MVADLFHYGHMEFLRKARELRTYLIAGDVADDQHLDRSGRPAAKERSEGAEHREPPERAGLQLRFNHARAP